MVTTEPSAVRAWAMMTCGMGTGAVTALAVAVASGLVRGAGPTRDGEVAGVLAAVPPPAWLAAGVTVDGELQAAVMQMPTRTLTARNLGIMRSFRWPTSPSRRCRYHQEGTATYP